MSLQTCITRNSLSMVTYQLHSDFFFKRFTFMCILCDFLCVYTHMSAGASIDQKRVLDPLVLELQVERNHVTWVQGQNLGLLEGQQALLNPEPFFQPTLIPPLCGVSLTLPSRPLDLIIQSLSPGPLLCLVDYCLFLFQSLVICSHAGHVQPCRSVCPACDLYFTCAQRQLVTRPNTRS